jgi:enamine deaminase RidA (YjgF/YER057c/UK114 family)
VSGAGEGGGDRGGAPAAVVVPGWPRPKGYANGVVGAGRVLFVAGQVGWDAGGRFASDELAAQFGQALANVLAVVRAAGGGPEHVASMTVYVTDILAYRASLPAIGLAWRAQMGKVFPAMALVAVSALVEPEAVVEIQAYAVLPG